MTTPLMILSDAPTTSSGLGRITRELATRIHEHLRDVFEVATYGYGGDPSSALPFKQYRMFAENYAPTNLPEIWRSFAGERKGIVLSIWNPAWLPWLGDPELAKSLDLYRFLKADPFQRWGYFPIDGDTINGRLPQNLGLSMSKFDRVLAYTAYGAEVIDASIRAAYSNPIKADGKEAGIPHLPHGIDTSVFYRRDRQTARQHLLKMVAGIDAPLADDAVMLGVVATNSPRKDWYLAFETCDVLKTRGTKIGIWVHTDHLRKSWDIPMLAAEFGLTGETVASNRVLNDEEMAWAYSAMDVTLAIGSGEGWGYPIAESLACSVPVVHGDYAGGAEFVLASGLVNPLGFRGDGFFGVRRPVYDANKWADAVERVLDTDASLPPYIKWNAAWPNWERWLLKGVR